MSVVCIFEFNKFEQHYYVVAEKALYGSVYRNSRILFVSKFYQMLTQDLRFIR